MANRGQFAFMERQERGKLANRQEANRRQLGLVAPADFWAPAVWRCEKLMAAWGLSTPVTTALLIYAAQSWTEKTNAKTKTNTRRKTNAKKDKCKKMKNTKKKANKKTKTKTNKKTNTMMARTFDFLT